MPCPQREGLLAVLNNWLHKRSNCQIWLLETWLEHFFMVLVKILHDAPRRGRERERARAAKCCDDGLCVVAPFSCPFPGLDTWQTFTWERLVTVTAWTRTGLWVLYFERGGIDEGRTGPCHSPRLVTDVCLKRSATVLGSVCASSFWAAQLFTAG